MSNLERYFLREPEPYIIPDSLLNLGNKILQLIELILERSNASIEFPSNLGRSQQEVEENHTYLIEQTIANCFP